MEKENSLRSKFINYNIRINIINGIAGAVALNLVPPYFPKLASRLGANDFHMGLLSSLPALVTIFLLIPGAMLIEGFSDKKKITAILLFMHKIFYLLIALVPFLPKEIQPIIFVSLVGLMNLPGAVSAMGFQASIADIFGQKSLGPAMAERNKYSTVFGTAVAFATGWLLTQLSGSERQTIFLYQIMLLITFAVAMGEVYSYLKFRGVKTAVKNSEKHYKDELMDTIRSLPRERKFIIFTACSLTFYFGWQMGWPLFNIYMIDYLKADEMWMAYVQIAGSISSIATYGLWAKFAAKRGNNFALFLATTGMAITPVLYAVSKNLPMLVAFNIVVGVSVAGTVQSLFNMLIEVTPQKNRTIYIAIYNTLINISAAVSPLIGVALKKHIEIYAALIVVAILRFIGSLSFLASNKKINKAA